MSHRAKDIIGDRYRLDEELGSGAMGMVWLATDMRLKRTVAVKLLDAGWAAEESAMQRFELEATAAAKVQSPHIVEIHDYGIDDENPYIVMEHIRGEDLKTRLKRIRRASLEETAEVILQVSKALAVAHAHGIVHRDLKPGNLMFHVAPSGEETLKVLDFGVAKSTEVDRQDATTKAGALLGTPQYMAPEQARGMTDVDHRADLWSLAVVAYRMLAGRRPFRGQSVPDTIVNICTTKAPPISKFRDDLPTEVDEWFLTALATDRGDRFQSAQELAESFFIMSQLSTPSMSLPHGRLSSPMFPGRISRPGPPSRSARDSVPPSVPGMDSFAGSASYPRGPVSETNVSFDAAGTLDTAATRKADEPSPPSSSLASAVLVPLSSEGEVRSHRNLRRVVAGVVAAALLFIGLVVIFTSGDDSDAATLAPATHASKPTEVNEHPAAKQEEPSETAAPPPSATSSTGVPSASAAPSASASAKPEATAPTRRWRPKTTDDEIFKERY